MTDLEHEASTRAVYDATAERYAQAVGTELSASFERPTDLARLGEFVELSGEATLPVADIGCGTGRVAAFLATHGLHVVGVDVAPAMLEIARMAHPYLAFVEGRLSALPFRDASLGGAVCWYSIIHTPPERLDEAIADLRRILCDGSHLLLGFQAGAGEAVERVDAYGTGLTLTNYRHSPDQVSRSLLEVGFQVRDRTVREAELAHESTPQAFILAVASGKRIN